MVSSTDCPQLEEGNGYQDCRKVLINGIILNGGNWIKVNFNAEIGNFSTVYQVENRRRVLGQTQNRAEKPETATLEHLLILRLWLGKIIKTFIV